MADPGTVAPRGSPLTVAESRVLEAMRVAANEHDAAIRLGLSPHTIHTHLKNVRSRLGVQTTRQAIVAVSAYHVQGVATTE